MNRDDALVEVYRDIMAIKRNLAAVVDSAPSVTPGAGRGCKPNRCVPGKRLRNWHRGWGKAQGLSLRQFARRLASGNPTSDTAIAKAWLASKGARS